MLKIIALAGALCCALATAAVAGTTQTYLPATGAYIDLGAGPLQVENQSANSVMICVGDSLPSPSSICHALRGGSPVPYPFPTASHLYAQAFGGSATVVVSPLQGGSATPSAVSDSQNAGYQGAVAMTVGTTYAAQRSVKANCTTTGNVSLTLSDGSTDVWIISAVGSTVIPYAATAINFSGTTATCTYSNLK
jgi:hypothetical protein